MVLQVKINSEQKASLTIVTRSFQMQLYALFEATAMKHFDQYLSRQMKSSDIKCEAIYFACSILVKAQCVEIGISGLL